MDRMLPVKSMVRSYSLHKNTKRSETVTSEKLLLAMVVWLSSGAMLMFTSCALEMAKIKLANEMLLTFISIFACSLKPGLSTFKDSSWFLRDSIRFCCCANNIKGIKKKSKNKDFFMPNFYQGN